MVIKCCERYNGFQQSQLDTEKDRLKNYLQNIDVGMSKETYYDMCEQMGTDPNNGDIPIEYDDITNQSQLALYIFEMLPDMWDTMNGGYLGKNLNNIEFILNMLVNNKSSWLVIIQLLQYIISMRVENINKKMKQRAKLKKKK